MFLASVFKISFPFVSRFFKTVFKVLGGYGSELVRRWQPGLELFLFCTGIRQTDPRVYIYGLGAEEEVSSQQLTDLLKDDGMTNN